MAHTEDGYKDKNLFAKCFACLELTSLNFTDNASSISAMIKKVNDFPSAFPDMPEIAAVCVFPSMLKTVRENLARQKVEIISVSGGFPAAQTFRTVQIAEAVNAYTEGADEIDVVLSVGKFLDGEYEEVAKDIRVIADIGRRFKVILETGALKTSESIYKAAMIAMENGANFIKTSTGKFEPAATHEAFMTMALAVRDFRERTGKNIGLKAAGGIVTSKDAVIYRSIVKHVLGEDSCTPQYFRIGASRLANNLLMDIEGKNWF
ncbi:MAG: deoxyribose-phosphate aldolase [Prevotellaceae bacterium]|nr:deoxyribose-phosphate aldolase [Prevotellaceae bacterium]